MINKRYIISKKIGEGRSKVFSVIDTEFPEREVAAKFLPVNSSPEEKQKFREEYFTLQKLDHPNIIKAFELSSVILKDDEEDAEIDQFSQFITMEYFPAQELLNYYGLIEERMLFGILKQICSVLYYLHQSNYIYYDLKAENILVAEINNKPVVKLIDLGFTQKVNKGSVDSIIGTPFYLAPELLKNESHDHRVDFYSLGILLYRIVYGKFPFSSEKEIDVYKAHIEEEFEFGQTGHSPNLIKVIVKLLKKNPVDRYKNALEIVSDLQMQIDLDLAKNFLPAKIFSDRKDALNIIGTYIKDKSSNEVFVVNGFDGAGKTALLQEISHQTNSSVYVENTKTKTGFDAIKYIFKKIIFSEIIFREKENEFETTANQLFADNSEISIDGIKKLFNTLPASLSFIILLDDFNLYDNFTRDTLTQLIQIMQVKGIKVILSESSDFDSGTKELNNLCPIQLNQFTEHQLYEFVDLSYSSSFPTEELKKIIMLYSDLLPGSIKQFIKDLILLKIIKYESDKIAFQTNENTSLTLQSSHEELYRIRLSNLTSTELRLSQIISAFDISLEQTVIAALTDISIDALKNNLVELEKKNIIESLNISNAPKINSVSFKNYIYSTINNRSQFHLIHANAIKKLFPDFNTVELARQYEIANEFEKSVEVLRKEIDKAEHANSFGYKKILLEKLLTLQLSEKTITDLRLALIKTYFQISNYKSTLESINKLNHIRLSESDENEILLLKGICLSETGQAEDAKKVFFNLLNITTDQKFKLRVNVALASAEYDLNNFEKVEEHFNLLMKETELTFSEQGRINNLMAMSEYISRKNISNALDYSFAALEKYTLANQLSKIAAIRLNIGTFYDALGNKKLAEENWQKALEINNSIGNLEQEGSILINYGVFHHNENRFEEALFNWNKAKIIFGAINIQSLYALTIGNMGEVYFQTSDYENCFTSLKNSISIFKEISNIDQELYFLFILGKFFYIVGNLENLKQTIDNYKSTFSGFNLSSQKNNYDLICLKLLNRIQENRSITADNEIIQAIENIINDGLVKEYVDVLFELINYLIMNAMYENGLKFLHHSEFQKIIEQNTILKSHQYYLFGKIAQQNQNLLELPAIEYFEDAYKLLEGESIIELTWKVLYEIAVSYYERGNFYKAKQPRIYAYELLNLIGDNITNSKIRNAYFNHPVRKNALSKLNEIANQTHLNEYQKS